jgi:hypothetical protein
MVLKEEGASDNLWSCPAAIHAPVGNVVQTRQIAATNGTSPTVRYWLWRLIRIFQPRSQRCRRN